MLKKMVTLLIPSSLATVLIMSNVYAADVTVLGSISHRLQPNNVPSADESNLKNKKSEKTIKLLRVELSEEKKQELKSPAIKAQLHQEVLKGLDSIEAAHEMIITGYDDNAVAVDNHGKNHKGLLTLRNSWGTSVGDYGEFYMSYDYFKLLAFDITRFTKPAP